MPRGRIKRTGDAHPAEAHYGASRPERFRSHPIDAHEFLDYCRLRAEVARMVEAVVRTHENCAMVGFLTGSVGPTVNARLLIERCGRAQVRFATDAKTWAPRGKTSQEAYEATLDDLWNRGRRHFVLADEYIGGGSINRALKLTWQWVRHRAHSAASFTIVGFAHDKFPASEAGFRSKIDEYRNCGMPICHALLFRCRKLLEMDAAGKIFNPVVKKQGHPGEYEFKRQQRGLHIRCPNDGADGGGGAYSSDQLFGALIEQVIGEKTDIGTAGGLITWPDTILTSSCEECKGLLCRARMAWEMRP